MDEYWTELFLMACCKAGVRLQQASQNLGHAVDSLQRAAQAARTAHEEHGDFRETIQRLEALIGIQSERITALERAIREKGSAS
jgi:ABC-type transporter Mla subunit MlaD